MYKFKYINNSDNFKCAIYTFLLFRKSIYYIHESVTNRNVSVFSFNRKNVRSSQYDRSKLIFSRKIIYKKMKYNYSCTLEKKEETTTSLSNNAAEFRNFLTLPCPSSAETTVHRRTLYHITQCTGLQGEKKAENNFHSSPVRGVRKCDSETYTPRTQFQRRTDPPPPMYTARKKR